MELLHGMKLQNMFLCKTNSMQRTALEPSQRVNRVTCLLRVTVTCLSVIREKRKVLLNWSQVRRPILLDYQMSKILALHRKFSVLFKTGFSWLKDKLTVIYFT